MAMPFHLCAGSRGIFTALLLIISVIVAGCTSGESADRAREGRPPRPALPTLIGRESFFDGRIVADIRIGALTGFDRRGDGEATGPEGRQRRPRPSSAPDMDRVGGGLGGPPMRPDREGDGSRPGVRMPMRGGSPPVAIHLRFTNASANAVDLQIVDFLSPLGNFVVHPATLKLQPGESQEVEPMTSRLAGEAGAGAIKLSLHLDGVKETKELTVQQEPDKPDDPKN
jgi:hypothetical protein